MSYDVAWTGTARRDMLRLTEAVATAVTEFIYGDLAEAPHRCCGAPLRPPLQELYRAKRGTYRVLLQIDDAAKMITIRQVKARSDAYRSQ